MDRISYIAKLEKNREKRMSRYRVVNAVYDDGDDGSYKFEIINFIRV